MVRRSIRRSALVAALSALLALFGAAPAGAQPLPIPVPSVAPWCC